MYNLKVLVNGRPIPVYNGPDGRKWVEAREGTSFEVKVENNGYNSILAVVSVDGLNVINAKHKDPMDSHGYIIYRNGSISIPGWKTNDNEVRKFLFTNLNNSYSNKIGDGNLNSGVIGAAIISEKQPTITYTNPWPYHPYHPYHYPYPYTEPFWTTTATTTTYDSPNTVRSVYTSNSNLESSVSSNISTCFSMSSDMSDSVSVSGGLSSPSIEKKVAVGSGDHKEFRTTLRDFKKDKVETVLSIFYDTRENLVRRGVIIENGPAPFPISGNYCPDV